MVYLGTIGECCDYPAPSGLVLVLMNHPFAEHLPWRVASLAGLIVGTVSLAAGVSVWNSLLRVGAAFLLFGLIGLLLRFALQQGAVPTVSDKARPGQLFDQTTPEEPGSPASSNQTNINDAN